jgi:hypothetical protein
MIFFCFAFIEMMQMQNVTESVASSARSKNIFSPTRSPYLGVWGILLRIGCMFSIPTSEIRPEVWIIDTSNKVFCMFSVY